MFAKIKAEIPIIKDIAVVVLLLLIAWYGWQIGGEIKDKLTGHDREIAKMNSSLLTIDTNGKQTQNEVKGFAKLIQQPSVYHQYYTSTVQGSAGYVEREKDPVTGKPTGAQIKGSMTMGALQFEWNGKKYDIPSNVVENGWLENGQFKFNIVAKNEVKVKETKAPSLDLVTKAGYGTNQIQDQMKPYGSIELEYRIHLLK